MPQGSGGDGLDEELPDDILADEATHDRPRQGKIMGDDDLDAALDRRKGPCDVHSSREAFDMPVRNPLVGNDFLHGGPAYRDTPAPGGHRDGRTALLALQHTDRSIMRQDLRPLVDLGGHLKDPTNIAVDLNPILCMHR